VTTQVQILGANSAGPAVIRLADQFGNVVSTNASGTAVVWNPGAANKFRLMGFTVTAAATLAAAGELDVELLDGVGGTVIWEGCFALLTTYQAQPQLGADFGQGYLSSAVGNELLISLSAAPSGGHVICSAWGTLN
jgi:hypothetical protein